MINIQREKTSTTLWVYTYQFWTVLHALKLRHLTCHCHSFIYWTDLASFHWIQLRNPSGNTKTIKISSFNLSQLINTISTPCASLVKPKLRQLCLWPIAVSGLTSSRTWKWQVFAIPWYVCSTSHCCSHALTVINMVSAGSQLCWGNR